MIEAKRFEGVFLCKKYAESKNQSLMKIHWYTNCLCANSPRASSRFNHVIEAKRFEGVFLCKKYAESKNQSLMKIHCYTNCLCANSPKPVVGLIMW